MRRDISVIFLFTHVSIWFRVYLTSHPLINRENSIMYIVKVAIFERHANLFYYVIKSSKLSIFNRPRDISFVTLIHSSWILKEFLRSKWSLIIKLYFKDTKDELQISTKIIDCILWWVTAVNWLNYLLRLRYLILEWINKGYHHVSIETNPVRQGKAWACRIGRVIEDDCN